MKKLSNILLLGLFFYSPAYSNTKSYIDSQYELSLSNAGKKSGGIHTRSSLVGFYQFGMSDFLGSDCSWMPADSRYAQMIIKKCGAFRGIVKTSARFLMEYDSAKLNYPVINSVSKNYFWDPPNDCPLF